MTNQLLCCRVYDCQAAGCSFFESRSADMKPTFEEISAIIKIGGGIDGLLNLWQVNLGRTDLYKGLACPVLSILAAGSMIVERVAKFFNRGVMTQGRGRLGAGSAETYLRVGLNLRFLLAHSEANASSAGAYAIGLHHSTGLQPIGLPHMERPSV